MHGNLLSILNIIMFNNLSHSTNIFPIQIEAHGIEILKNEERHLTEEEVRSFYSHLQEEPFFDELVGFMTSGNSHVLVLTKGRTGENIISEFRDLIGPTAVEEAKEAKPERWGII